MRSKQRIAPAGPWRRLSMGSLLALAAPWAGHALQLDAVATVEASVEVGESGFFNGSETDGSFGNVQTSGNFVGTYTFVEECDVVLQCETLTRTITLREDTGGGLVEVGNFNVFESFESFELFYFEGCIAPTLCDVPLLAVVDDERQGTLRLRIVEIVSGFTPVFARVPGGTPFSFDFSAAPRDAGSASYEVHFGFPEEGADGVVRSVRFDGQEVETRVIEPPQSIRRAARGGQGARFGSSVEVGRGGVCVGQAPASSVGSATEASVSIASGVFDNLGAASVSTTFGKFPFGLAVSSSGNRCASSSEGTVTICEGNCSRPLVMSAPPGQPGFGRSVSISGSEVYVGGGSVDTDGRVYQYVLSGREAQALLELTSSDPEFGATALAPTRASLVTTLTETTFPDNIRRTRTDLLRVSGIQEVLFDGDFEPVGLR